MCTIWDHFDRYLCPSLTCIPTDRRNCADGPDDLPRAANSLPYPHELPLLRSLGGRQHHVRIRGRKHPDQRRGRHGPLCERGASSIDLPCRSVHSRTCRQFSTPSFSQALLTQYCVMFCLSWTCAERAHAGVRTHHHGKTNRCTSFTSSSSLVGLCLPGTVPTRS